LAIAYLNGSWKPPEQLSLSPLDRGFLFGDGVYEGLAIYHGQVFELDAHLVRLRQSLASIQLDPGVSDVWLQQLMEEGIRRSGLVTASCYLQITRGVDDTRNHIWPNTVSPTIFLMISESARLENRNNATITPLNMTLLEDYRWQRGDIKSISLLANGLLKNEAVSLGFDDAILIREGQITESTSSNVFLVKKGRIVTPPASMLLLNGITRQVVLKLAALHQLPFAESACSLDDLRSADEVWITSTGHEVWPVGRVGDQAVGTGLAGPVWQQMDELFQKHKALTGHVRV